MKSGKAWLHATLTVKSSKLLLGDDGQTVRPGLPASGVFVINPPFTLKAALKDALPQLATVLAQDDNASSTLDSGS
jgi:23S rRNA (adenine2030-N6)-methyltransferase